jgi:plasmid segregation protein ParM
MCVAFDSNGNETGRAGDDESWGVVEIGHFTTDFTFHDRGQEVDAAASSSPGVIVVYERIGTIFKQNGYLSDFDNISTAIKTTKIKCFGEMLDVAEIVSPIIREFSNQILEEVTTRFGEKAQRMDGIVVAGGGSFIVGADIKAKFKNTIIPPNARMTVAEGYARFGLVTLG